MRWELLILMAALMSVAKSVNVNLKVDNGKIWTSTLNHEKSLKAKENNETILSNDQMKRATKENTEEGDGNTDEDSSESTTDIALEVIVQTENGPVKGYGMPGTTEIIQFFDIPYGLYAKNFENPTKPKQWQDVREITEHTIVCPQLDSENKYQGQRDCLTLSIFTPHDANETSVLVHIHDGDFLNKNEEISPEILVSRGIILVVPNFRIGAFGFLCLQNETAPGNAGLKDLTLALEWTAENIGYFGGNPNDVTVSGVDKAGALVGHLMLSPKSRRYVTKAITESGSVLSHWALDRNPIETASELAEILRQDNHIDGTIFADDINEMNLVLASKDLTFRPCIETDSDAFITESPWSILQNYKTNISVMAGTANHAGLLEALAANITLLNDNFQMILPKDLQFEKGEQQRIETANKLRNIYFGINDTIEETDIVNISLCYTDSLYLSPDIRTARYLITAGAKVHFFEFAFADDTEESIVKGALRGDVIKYVFASKKQPDTGNAKTNEDVQYMIKLMTDLWVSFIQEGSPKGANVTWNELTPASETDEAWLSIDTDVILHKGLHIERLALWTEIYEEHYVEHNSSTQRHPLQLIFYMTIALTLKLTLIFS